MINILGINFVIILCTLTIIVASIIINANFAFGQTKEENDLVKKEIFLAKEYLSAQQLPLWNIPKPRTALQICSIIIFRLLFGYLECLTRYIFTAIRDFYNYQQNMRKEYDEVKHLYESKTTPEIKPNKF